MKTTKYIITFLLLSVSLFLSFSIFSPTVNALVKAFNNFSSYALKDPFYPDYPQRRVLFTTTNLSWWGNPGLTKYTITAKDPRVGNKSVVFYSSGYTKCAGGLEMGLPFGNALGSGYNYYPCSLTASDDFHFLLPFTAVTTQQAVLDSAANIISNDGLNADIYLPLSWWNK